MPKEYPVLTNMLASISFCIVEDKDMLIGASPPCDIILHSSEAQEKHAKISYSYHQCKLSMIGDNRCKVNGQIIPNGEHLLQPGDRIELAETLFLFQFLSVKEMINPNESWSLDSQYATQQVATESFRIISEEAPSVFRKTVTIAVIWGFLISLSYMLFTGKLLYYRQLLQQQYKISTSIPTKTPEVTSGYQIQWVASDEVMLVKVVGDAQIEKMQDEIFQRFALGEYQQAQALYTAAVYDKLKSPLVRFENALKYNGWAFRWFNALEEIEKKQDEKLLNGLRQEVEMVSKQVDENLQDTLQKRHFENLLRYVSQRISQAR